MDRSFDRARLFRVGVHQAGGAFGDAEVPQKICLRHRAVDRKASGTRLACQGRKANMRGQVG